MATRIALLTLLLTVTLDCIASSIQFIRNEADNVDYARQLSIPSAFGRGEFTLELWIKPNHLLPVGRTSTNSEKLNNWSNTDNAPYSSDTWWYAGNFLLDGFNNGNNSSGTFALQFYGGGRVRWMLGDRSSVAGGVRSVGAYPANSTPHLLDGRWHQLTLIRRWVGTSAAQLELWIDGVLIDTEAGTRIDMRQWWNTWPDFAPGQAGWFWGAEKQAALGALWEDYRGLIDELRFWSRAKSTSEVQANWTQPVFGTETGLVGWYSFGEISGNSVCDTVSGPCMSLYRTTAATFSAEEAPLNSVASSGNVAFSSATYSAQENSGVVTISVARNGGSAGAASVNYSTGGGSALANADYEPISGTLSWAAGQSGLRSFQVRLFDDQEPEGNETINVGLSTATGAALQSPGSAVITITANDQPPPPGPPPPSPSPSPSPGTTWSDDFNRANGSSLSSGWIEKNPAGFSIASGAVRKADTVTDWRDNLVYRPSSEDLRDVEASMELRLTSLSLDYPGVIVRAQPATIGLGTRWDGYLLYMNNSRTQAVLARQSGTGWDTVLAYINLTSSLNTTNNYRLRLRAVGTAPVQLNGYVEVQNGSSWQILGQASYADSSSARFSGAGSVGFSAHYSFSHILDNFRRVDLR